VSLCLEALSAGYRGRDVVREVSLALEPGTVTALIGPNGSGKSTLVKGGAGLLPSRGGIARRRARRSATCRRTSRRAPC